MANKRDLKRTINYITSELFAETVAASLYNGKPTQEDVDGILSAIVMINGDYISRVSHPEPGITKGEYYKKLTVDFNKQVSEIIDQISYQFFIVDRESRIVRMTDDVDIWIFHHVQICFCIFYHTSGSIAWQMHTCNSNVHFRKHSLC